MSIITERLLSSVYSQSSLLPIDKNCSIQIGDILVICYQGTSNIFSDIDSNTTRIFNDDKDYKIQFLLDRTYNLGFVFHTETNFHEHVISQWQMSRVSHRPTITGPTREHHTKSKLSELLPVMHRTNIMFLNSLFQISWKIQVEGRVKVNFCQF